MAGAYRDGAAQARLAAQRAALVEVELERARMALEDERAARDAARRRTTRDQTLEQAMQFAKLLLPRVPRPLSQEALERFSGDLALLSEQAEPGSVTAVTVAELLVEAARLDIREQAPAVEEPRASVSLPLLYFMALRSGLL